MQNKKIINATPKSYDGINFKSTLEVSIYKYLKDTNFNVLYEPDTFILLDSFTPPLCIVNGKIVKRKILKITYTPDFKVEYKNKIIYIEVKGFCNDVYPYKKKLFLNKIKDSDIIFIEVHSKKELLDSLKLIEENEKISK